MKQGWEIKRLGEVCSFSQGIQVPIEEQYTKCEEGMIRFLRIIDFTQKGESPRYIQGVCDKYILHDDEIAIVRYGTPGFVCYGESGAIANNLFKITQKKAYFNHNYLRYWLQSDSFQSVIKSNKYGVALKAIKFSTINDIPIPVPPLAEQERIVAELDCLSGVIEKKKQQLKELDALAQSIFYEMFGDPITNEKGWEVKKLGDVSKIITGTTPSTKDDSNWDSEINWVTPAELNIQLYYGETERKISKKAAKSLSIMPIGTVLLSTRAPIGKIAITTVPMCCNQGFKNMICNDDLNNIFLYYYLMLTMDEIKKLGRGATFKEVSKQDISNYQIINPPLSLQQVFASKIEAIEKKKELIKQSIKEVETLFNSRMDYYFN